MDRPSCFTSGAVRAAKWLGGRVYRTGSAGRYMAGDRSLSYIRSRVCHVILLQVRDITISRYQIQK